MNTTPTVDNVLRRYLLGTIEPEIRDDVEGRLFSDDKIFLQQLCLAEDELIDDYVRGELSADNVQSFEQFFLSAGERHDKLSFARALKAHAESRQRASGRARHPLQGWLLLPSWAAAAAGVLLFVLPTLTWQLARPDASGEDVSAWLSSGLVRSVGGTLERVQIPNDARLVRLRLEPDGTEYPHYRATLHLIGGEEIWSQSRLQATDIDGREGIALTLPAELLPAGDYYIRLHGEPAGRAPVPLDRFDFRVLR